MNNIKKITKTALFASLIITMILPFSGMRHSFVRQTPREESEQPDFIKKDMLHVFKIMEKYDD